MKLKYIILLLIITPLPVLAQENVTNITWPGIPYLGKFMTWLRPVCHLLFRAELAFPGIDDPCAIGAKFILVFMVWLIFFIATKDIVYSLTAFSEQASWVIGFALAVIAANTGTVAWIVTFLMGFTTVLGGISIFAAIIAAFILFLLAHLVFFRGFNWIAAHILQTRASRGYRRVKAAVRGLKEIEEAMEE